MDLMSFITSRKEKLAYYSPYHYIPEIDTDDQIIKLIIEPIKSFATYPNQQVVSITIESQNHFFLVQYLPWDSHFFERPVYKLITVLYQHQNFHLLSEAVGSFIKQFFTISQQYCFIELPAEDMLLLQALNTKGFKLVETRLLYYKKIGDFTNERFGVRESIESDIEILKRVASSSRNHYDRFHAEPAFGEELADKFLGKYAAEAAKGYCDTVLVPNEPEVPTEAFVAISHLKEAGQFGFKISKIVLAASLPSCKGWHYKLISEAIYCARSAGSSYMLMTTQATNRAVIRNNEKLTFSLGATHHILSYYQ